VGIQKHFRLFGLLLLTGCSALGPGRFIESPESQPVELAIRANGEEVKAVLHHVIVPDGPGSWVKGATWNEMVISLQNASRGDVTIKRISVIDSTGLYVNPIIPNVLPSATERVEKMQGMSLLIQGVGVAGQLLGAFSGMPLLGIASGAFIVNAPAAQAGASAKEMDQLLAEVKRRMLAWPIEMTAGATVRGSQFFSAPDPKMLVITYQTAKGEKHLKLALDQISFAAVKN